MKHCFSFNQKGSNVIFEVCDEVLNIKDRLVGGGGFLIMFRLSLHVIGMGGVLHWKGHNGTFKLSNS